MVGLLCSSWTLKIASDMADFEPPWTCSSWQLRAPLLFSGCRLWGRKSPGMQRGRGGAKRTLSSMSWPRCCHFRAPSPVSWTRHPSSGSPSATWRWGTSPIRATHRGTCEWRALRPTPPSKVRRGGSKCCLRIFRWLKLFVVLNLCPG